MKPRIAPGFGFRHKLDLATGAAAVLFAVFGLGRMYERMKG